MTNATTNQPLVYNGTRIIADALSTTSPRFAPASRIRASKSDDDATAPMIITTKRLSLVQDFLGQVWYGILEIKAWRKKFGVYIIDLVPSAGRRFDFTEFMKSWMEVHIRFELQA